MNNLWQILQQLYQHFNQQQIEDPEEQRRRELAAQLLGRDSRWQGTNDNGMPLEEMFRRFRPTLSQGMQGNPGGIPMPQRQLPMT